VDSSPILVVDDDPCIREMVAQVLTSEGYPVVTAANGAEALEIVEREHPALVLLDMRMPIVSGWDFAQELTVRGVALPIVVMTAALDARRWAEEIGAAGYLAKPFDLMVLLDTVAGLSAA
jgi:urea transport system substrate-binding protein